MLINSSRLDQFQKCNRLYYWTNLFDLGGNSPGVRPQRPNNELQTGVIVHIGAANFYRGKPIKAYREEALQVLDFDALTWDERNYWLDRFEWVDRLLGEYEIWAGEQDDFEVVDVEQPFFVTLGEICYSCGQPYSAADTQGLFSRCEACLSDIHRLAGMTDLLVRHNDRLKVIDHKTAKSTSESYLTSWLHSLQLWGYAYGRQKATGEPVVGYAVNILRKLETVGLPQQTTKQCPDCRNGVRKKLSCSTCAGEGRVEKENNPSDTPFVRVWEKFDGPRAELLVRARLRTIQDIKREEEHFESEPDAAYPMNTTHCFTYGVCPMLKLCWHWGLDHPEKWYEPPIELLDQFDPQPDDYLTTERLLLEEMK